MKEKKMAILCVQMQPNICIINDNAGRYNVCSEWLTHEMLSTFYIFQPNAIDTAQMQSQSNRQLEYGNTNCTKTT